MPSYGNLLARLIQVEPHSSFIGKVVHEIYIPTLQELWVLPLFSFLHVMSAYVVVRILNFVLRIEGADAKVTFACTMFGDCDSLAIAVISSLGSKFVGFLHTGQKIKTGRNREWGHRQCLLK